MLDARRAVGLAMMKRVASPLVLGPLLGLLSGVATCTPAVDATDDPAGGGGGGTGGIVATGGAGMTGMTKTGGVHGHVDAASGAPGAGGNGGNGGSDDAATADDAGDDSAMAMPVTDPATLAIAGELQGAFLQVDCASPEIELQYCHPKDKGIQNLTFKFGGQTGKIYDVVLRVWGVVEGVRYTGGKPGGEHFYIGGKGSTPGTAEYGLVVGKQTYYLNYYEQDGGEHYTYGVSYQTVSIPIPGGAVIGLYVHDPDDFMNTNHMDSNAANPSPGLLTHLEAIKSQPLQGQYVYLEIASATLAP
jgi:hypothetical protein